jgi:hypothetical protein
MNAKLLEPNDFRKYWCLNITGFSDNYDINDIQHMNIKLAIDELKEYNFNINIESETSNWMLIEILYDNEELILEHSLLICRFISPKLELQI